MISEPTGAQLAAAVFAYDAALYGDGPGMTPYTAVERLAAMQAALIAALNVEPRHENDRKNQAADHPQHRPV